MYAFAAPFIGIVITVMNGINSRFSDRAGMLVSAIVIHAAGLALLCLAFPFFPRNPRGRRLPAYRYSGGLVGIATLVTCNAAYSGLGASLAVALALLGQTAFSIAVDVTGFLGRPRYPLDWKHAPGIVGAVAGIALMWAFAPAAAATGALPAPILFAMAFVAGGLPVVSFVLNSQLALEIGPYRSTRANYVVGLGALCVAAAFARPALPAALDAVSAAGPLLALGGGALGVAVVASANVVYPRLPAFLSTLLIFSGQVVAGLAMDAFSSGAFDAGSAAGAACILVGLGLNAFLGAKSGKELPMGK